MLIKVLGVSFGSLRLFIAESQQNNKIEIIVTNDCCVNCPDFPHYLKCRVNRKIKKKKKHFAVKFAVNNHPKIDFDHRSEIFGRKYVQGARKIINTLPYRICKTHCCIRVHPATNYDFLSNVRNTMPVRSVFLISFNGINRYSTIK